MRLLLNIQVESVTEEGVANLAIKEKD